MMRLISSGKIYSDVTGGVVLLERKLVQTFLLGLFAHFSVIVFSGEDKHQYYGKGQDTPLSWVQVVASDFMKTSFWEFFQCPVIRSPWLHT